MIRYFNAATIERVERGGLAFVRVGEESLPFSFDKIDGYKGEKPGAVGLFKGVQVEAYVTLGKVSRVVLKSPLSQFPQPKGAK